MALLTSFALNRRLAWAATCLTLSTGCAATPKEFESTERFEEIGANFVHQWNEAAHPFLGAAVIDVNGDGALEVFVSGSEGQDDALFSYREGKLQDVIAGTGLSSDVAGYGPVSIDIDGDNDTDLIVARNDGVHLYTNARGQFTSRKLNIELPAQSVPLSVAVSDIDRDGDADLYISAFVDPENFRSAVYNDPAHAKTNVLLLNNGDSTFTDITETSNTAGMQNTFLSVFTDLDNDGWQDLVVSQNTGEVEIFRNNRDRTFTAIATNTGFGFWMGIAVGDIDHDGDQDLFFSNVGDSIPSFLTTGDLRDDQPHNLDWRILRNEGDFNFSDATLEYGIEDEGFAWGAVFEDLNADGQLDLLVAQNYIKWPIHKLFKLTGRTYLGSRGSGKLHHVEALGLENPYFGQSPVIADLDSDGRPDVLWVNMDGPVRAFLNRSSNNYLRVAVPEQVELLGTRVRVETSDGPSYTREVMTSTGMLTDQTADLVFGVRDGVSISKVVIEYPDGSSQQIDSPDINSTIILSKNQ
ncbi:MAG: CRTAC1 family protein [Pseudomonadota bacterium]